MTTATDDMMTAVIKEIDARVASYMTTLLNSDASRHDKLCGLIIGLNEAANIMRERAKLHRMRDFDPDDDPAPSGTIRAVAAGRFA